MDLSRLIEVAAAHGHVTLMKHADVRNDGKPPHLVLAEAMISVKNWNEMPSEAD
jgi:hypothetical protein